MCAVVRTAQCSIVLCSCEVHQVPTLVNVYSVVLPMREGLNSCLVRQKCLRINTGQGTGFAAVFAFTCTHPPSLCRACAWWAFCLQLSGSCSSTPPGHKAYRTRAPSAARAMPEVPDKCEKGCGLGTRLK